MVTFGDGDVEPAFGLFGGRDGTLNRIEFRYPDGSVYRATSKDMVTGVPSGTIYRQEAGGGGGYGDPKERPVEAVAAEVRNGIVSVEVAREIYGVALDPETSEVDEEETRTLRGA